MGMRKTHALCIFQGGLNMSYKDFSFYISHLQFNNGTTLDINQGDIIVFVGANNVGKSQCLKDIQLDLIRNTPSTVLTNLSYQTDVTNMKDYLDSICSGKYLSDYYYYTINGKQYNCNTHSYNLNIESNLHQYVNLFVANVDTKSRLNITDPKDRGTIDDGRQDPIDFVVYDQSKRLWLSKNFEKAFGVDILPDILTSKKEILRIGHNTLLEGNFEDEQTRQEAYMKWLSHQKQLHEQGDGYKSFAGVLLYLMLDYYKVFLIDEPEAFLHPPQAKIMGTIIGQTLNSNQQAFISTHSEELIKGLLESCPERVRLIRVNRNGDNNSFSILNSDQIIEIWGDSFLKYSNLMSGLFYKSVVACEGDGDCKLYSIIDGYIKNKAGLYSESLFVNCGGKGRIYKVAKALSSLSVDCKVIVDLDIFENKNDIVKLVESKNIQWSEIENDYTILMNDIKSSNLKWNSIKRAGVPSFPAGTATKAFNRINKLLKEHSIFVVPVGELESFVKEAGTKKHGSEWVTDLLEQYPDLEAHEYDSVRHFVSEINI